jgi:4-aminobutyrate aminotransferase
MSVRERSAAAEVEAGRARYVARGVATPRLVVGRAEGARVEDPDGRSYIDFAGGIACQNLGHRPDAVTAAIREQLELYLHQCFMVGTYAPYVEVCRRLDELSPCRGEEQKSLLVNSGAEAVENAVKISRAATGRQAVVVFDNAFHGRTLLTMTMTSKVSYRRGFGPFAPEVYRATAPYPYRGVTTDDALAGLERLFATEVDPANVACLVLEPVQGEGGFIPMPTEFLAGVREICDRHGILWVDDEVQSGVGRTGTVWAVEQLGAPEPDLLVSGKSLGGGLPLAAVTGRAEVVDAPAPGALGGTFGGNPLSCAAAIAVLDEVSTPAYRERARAVESVLRHRLEALEAQVEQVGEVRGLGAMLALELVDGRSTRAPATALAAEVVAHAFDRGLLLLACGLHGNVIRLLPPIAIADDDLERGLDVLQEALGAAAGTR